MTSLTAWDQVQLARHPDRPHTLDFVAALFGQFVELRGDRQFRDDRALVGGLAHWNDRTVVVIGTQKGRGVNENVERNFGLPQPEGYRKALRLMRLAEKFGFPVITFIDTPGASPDKGAEERGQAQALADNLLAMAGLKVPIIGVIIGEGNSGGALAIGLVDRLLMLEHSYFSVVTPEGCASILWRDPKFAPQAAEAMKITAPDLIAMGLIDEIVPEPEGGAHLNSAAAFEMLREPLGRHLADVSQYDVQELLDRRYDRYRVMGAVTERFPVSV